MNIDTLPTPLFIAHRGLRIRFPENTLAAFNGAVAAGAQMIELDISLSRDRKLVVIHDDTVDRTTNGSGAVKALTMEDLCQLDAGSWFDPRFKDERLRCWMH
jgi:glycerophosphoryl diester phosphodiesterase